MNVARHFNRIDLQEAYQLFGLVKVDFDETYPHVTAKLQTWMDTWQPHCQLPDIAKREGKGIRFYTHKGTEFLAIDTPRDIVIDATVILINLTRPSFSGENKHSVDNLIRNIFSREAKWSHRKIRS